MGNGAPALDILMISLVPLGVFLVVLLSLAAFWRWDSPTDKAWTVAIAVASFAVVMSGWLLYRFGWDGTSAMLVGGSVAIVVASFFMTRLVAGSFRGITGANSPSPTWQDLKTGAPILIPVFVAIIMGAGIVLWSALK